VTLFDKIADITLIPKSGPAEYIKTPAAGMKPYIDISGHSIPDEGFSDLEIRIKNFYPSHDLCDYESIVLKAGYTEGPQATFQGSIMSAYQESPGPESTIFLQMKVGKVVDWLNNTVTGNFKPFTLLSSVFSEICKAVGCKVNACFNPSLACTAPIHVNGIAIDALREVCITYQLIFRVDGDTVTIYPKTGYTDKVYLIEYVSSPPQKVGNGWIFSAPWFPALRFGDVVKMNPKYFQATYGNAQITNSVLQKVTALDFKFSTVGSNNTMNVRTISTSEVKA
jgi:hypothetical protein